MQNNLLIHWFRQDLRLSDNPALLAAVQQGRVLPVYILDDVNAGQQQMGAASRCWLHHSLVRLSKSLKGHLHIYRGDAGQVLLQLCKQHGVKAVFWNRCYEPWRLKRDEKVTQQLTALGVDVHTFNASLLWEPWQVHKADGTPYRVFTPYYQRGCLAAEPVRLPVEKPFRPVYAKGDFQSLAVSDLELLPATPWDKGLFRHWQVGEGAAHAALDQFIEDGLSCYKKGRDYPADNHVSRLSPYLHWGELSPHQVWHSVRQAGDNSHIETYLRQLGWREFSYYLLYHFPRIVDKNLLEKFNVFPWRRKNKTLQSWQQGKTGYPIIDAGMRELWQTGYMHNRVRMIVGSFLVKNLLINWRQGAAWFWDCLFDADLANNSASWQWVAGCGADAAPYFRIFNPVTQGHKFDPDGEYIRRFVPEIRLLPDKYLFSPWAAPDETLAEAGVRLGVDYPFPIVDLRSSREEALRAFRSLPVRSTA